MVNYLDDLTKQLTALRSLTTHGINIDTPDFRMALTTLHEALNEVLTTLLDNPYEDIDSHVANITIVMECIHRYNHTLYFKRYQKEVELEEVKVTDYGDQMSYYEYHSNLSEDNQVIFLSRLSRAKQIDLDLIIEIMCTKASAWTE